MFNNRPHLWPSVSLWEEGEAGINLLEPLLWASTSTVLSVLRVAKHLLSVNWGLLLLLFTKENRDSPREKMTCLREQHLSPPAFPGQSFSPPPHYIGFGSMSII